MTAAIGTMYPKTVVKTSKPDFRAFDQTVIFPSLVSWKKSLYILSTFAPAEDDEMNEPDSVDSGCPVVSFGIEKNKYSHEDIIFYGFLQILVLFFY